MPHIISLHVFLPCLSVEKSTAHSSNQPTTYAPTSSNEPSSIHNIHCIESIYTCTDISRRHKRTHDRGDGVDGPINYSGEEEEDFSGEDHLGSLEEASPTSENAYVTASLNGMAHDGSQSNVVSTQGYNSLQTLSMPMTLSQPAMNAGVM